MDAVYRVRNSGNEILSTIELHLPGRRSFRFENPQALWDGAALTLEASPENSRNTRVVLPRPWKTSESHTLQLSAEFRTSLASDAGFAFTSDAFFLPSAGWAPELLPSRGIFATGGVPPKEWRLTVQVPRGLLVHTSGKSTKTSRSSTEVAVQAIQTTSDRYPFVIAGSYKETPLDTGTQKVFLWARSSMEPASLHSTVEAVGRVLQTFDANFGSRAEKSQPLWIVECPRVPGCFSSERSAYAEFLGAEPGAASAELASDDTLMLDFAGGAPRLGTAAPALAASWLGYGQSPGFYDQDPPLSAFPAFASSLGREAVLGPTARSEAIARALRAIPRNSTPRKPEGENVLRAKGFLFFYALQERYGQEVFRRAIQHMLSARRGGGFDLNDLIAAFEQETHQNVAEFVRLWMKRPGVPEEFRARHESSSAVLITIPKENMP